MMKYRVDVIEILVFLISINFYCVNKTKHIYIYKHLRLLISF